MSGSCPGAENSLLNPRTWNTDRSSRGFVCTQKADLHGSHIASGLILECKSNGVDVVRDLVFPPNSLATFTVCFFFYEGGPESSVPMLIVITIIIIIITIYS